MSNLQLRIISGIVLATTVLLATFAGGIWFRLLAVVMGASVYVEWRSITGCKPVTLVGRGAELLFVLSLAAIVVPLPAPVVFLLLLGSTLVGLLAFGEKAKFWLGTGMAYAGFPAASLANLRADSNNGLFLVLFLFAIVWATDIFAYFVGRSLGGPKLAPTISPGKTVSGAIGGLAAAVAAGLAIAMASGPAGNPLLVLLIVLVSVVSQAGDLFESWVKRRNGVKDSGTIIPGHGGVMDRVDGLAVAAFALYVLDNLMRAF
jgi:phosphatidate cytidylyltransferase